MAHPLQLFEISSEEIARVVARFYARVREHETLGPVFGAHVTDWPEHEDKIAAFWRNAILKEGSYSGNPMRVHLSTPQIEPGHFADWLTLFDEVLMTTLPEETARSFSALAHRIGRGFRIGIEQVRLPVGQPPILR